MVDLSNVLLQKPEGDATVSPLVPSRMAAAQFVARPAQSQGTIETTFRIHMSPDSLELLGLKIGDLCEIFHEDGTTAGFGISWRAAEGIGSNPKVKPVKMTETLRGAFSIAYGAHVGLSKTSTKKMHAEKVVLSDVTPSDYDKKPDVEDNGWRWRCGGLLSKLWTSLTSKGAFSQM